MNSFLNPEEVLNQLEISENAIVADFGCGSGGWVIPLAKRLKNSWVYAIDILEEPLSALKSKAELENVSNIEIIRANIEGENTSKLPDNSCDLVLMTNLLFQAEDKKVMLEEAKRALKEGGRILVVDWKKESPFGPKEKVLPEEIKKIAKDLKLRLGKEFPAGTYHYVLVFVK